ncbi:tape measure protein [Providencia phage vB_PreS_PR1]|uniref:Tape measure protein n=1 Tax=Providencia phage vB_PreS_PR1 TaxID=1931407 RepID=A0A1S6KUU1_9CAUD|nr:tail length tape measure protein [Providencia phage vB_PreS_PR1]AQT25203.1 tape measure protein [Providencia phage vB_PreS_PR1]
MADKMIREVEIDVTQKGVSKTTTSIKNLSQALEDAAAGSELTTDSLKSMAKEMQKVQQYADSMAGSFDKVGNSKGLKMLDRSIKEVASEIRFLTQEFQQFSSNFVVGMNNITKFADRMENNVVRAIEDVGDSMNTVTRHTRGYGQAADDAARRSGKFTRAVGDTSGAARGATRDFAALARIAGPIPMLYGQIAANVFALQQAFRVLQAGDQVNTLNKLGIAMTSISGTPTQLLAQSLQEATGNAISFEEAMAKATKATQLGASAADLEKLGKVAQRASAAGFTSMADAVERVINGVYKLDAASLSGAGLAIDLSSAYKKYADQLNAAGAGLNYNSQNLSKVQKQQALLNAVVEQSNNALGKLDAALASSAWDKFGANISSSSSKLASLLASRLTPLIDILNRLLEISDKVGDIGDNLKLVRDGLKVTDVQSGGFVSSMETVLEQEGKLMDEYSKAEKERAIAIKNLADLNKTLQFDNGTDAALAKTSHSLVSLTMFGDLINMQDSSIGKWKAEEQAVKDAEQKVRSYDGAVKELQTTITAMRDMSQGTALENAFQTIKIPMGDMMIESVAIKEEFRESLKTVDELRNYAKEGKASISESMNNLSDTSKARAGLEQVRNTINALESGSNAFKGAWENIAQSIGLAANEMQRLKAQERILTEALEVYDEYGANSVALAKERLALAQKLSGQAGSATKVAALNARQQANEAKSEIALLNKQLDSGLLSEGSAAATRRRINELEVQMMNNQISALTKEKTVQVKTEKTILDLSGKIALVNNHMLSDYEYQNAMKKEELRINEQNMAHYKGKADKQNEYNQSLLTESQIRRDMAFMEKAELNRQAENSINFGRSMFDTDSTKTAKDSLLRDIADFNEKLNAELASSEATRTAVDQQKILELKQEIVVAETKLVELENERQRMYANATTGLLGGTGQSTLGMGEDAKQQQDYVNNQQGYAEALSNLQAINSEATAVGTNLGNVMNAVMLYADGALDATSTAAAGMQLLSSVFNMSAKQQTSAIDMAIKAEQQRDGKSEESKAKIKKMEAEKIKIQQDSAKKQILIQTAVAVMQAANAVPYPWSIPLMIAAAASGAMAYAQASTPTSPSMDVGGGESGYLKLGERENKFDVSQNGTAGELAYTRGEKGIGSAQNFIPRAEGGTTLPGVGYIYGEHGVEIASSGVPGRVTSNDNIGSGGSESNTTVVHINTIDAASFAEFASRNKETFRDAVEWSLNEEGATLVR